MKRLTDISEKMLVNKKNGFEESFISNVEQFPYFTYHVKDVYFKFIENTAKICKEKCMDEFYCTRTIYWDLTSE